MIINESSLRSLFSGFSTSFNKGLGTADSHYKDIAMTVPSTASDTTYGWLGQFPKLREWIGDRVVENLVTHRYSVSNRKFESTVNVPRTAVEDDLYGVYGPLMQEMGKTSGEFPDELVFDLLAKGFSSPCYDGRNFFDSAHPVGGSTRKTETVSNMQDGSNPPWFLLDTSRAIRPMLWQTRIPFQFTALTSEHDENVFWRDEYTYGVRGRANAGFGLWQLAFGSKAELTAANYAAARTAMMSLKGEAGRPLAIRPTTLVVSSALEEAGLKLLNAATLDGAATNPWCGTAKLIVTPWAG